MAIKLFHIRGTAKRRGGNLPARLRFSARRGVTLVELMISMLILTLVCVAWLEIIGIQSAKKEARRREAVERLAGMMDAFLYINKTNEVRNITKTCYMMTTNGAYQIAFNTHTDRDVCKVFEDDSSPIGYQLLVASTETLDEETTIKEWGYEESVWGGKSSWLIGKLYNYNGKKKDEDNPFFVLPVCLGFSNR